MEKFEVKYTGTNDFIFKTIFQYPEILSMYLKLLGINIKPEEIVYENVEVKNGLRIKSVIFDIKIKALNTQIDIESQRRLISGKDSRGRHVDGKTHHRRRKIHYLSVLHSNAYKDGDLYLEERKSKVIFFLDCGSKEQAAIQRTKMVNTSTEEIYDDVEIIDVYLKKKRGNESVKDKMLNVLTKKDLTKYYEEEGIVGGVAKMIFELNKEECHQRLLQYVEETKKDLAESRRLLKKKYKEAYNTGREEGEEKGFLKGEEKKAISTAKRLKMMGSTDEFISEATGLSLKRVKRLK
ncbi:MAG: hypothetical protein K2N42_00880 [Anaeroplasmataceae bacterium]|nr:hypothetical protein [Anaeroplasmataceae bacterium]